MVKERKRLMTTNTIRVHPKIESLNNGSTAFYLKIKNDLRVCIREVSSGNFDSFSSRNTLRVTVSLQPEGKEALTVIIFSFEDIGTCVIKMPAAPTENDLTSWRPFTKTTILAFGTVSPASKTLLEEVMKLSLGSFNFIKSFTSSALAKGEKIVKSTAAIRKAVNILLMIISLSGNKRHKCGFIPPLYILSLMQQYYRCVTSRLKSSYISLLHMFSR